MTRRTPRRRRAPAAEGGSFNRSSAVGLVLVGLLMGLAGALYYAWVLAPIVYTEVGPARFSDKYKREYIYLVSQSYAANGDWAQAEQRLKALEDPALNDRVGAQLEAYLREQQEPQVIQNLARLAQNLGVEGKVVALFAPTPSGLLPTETATPPPNSEPTLTPTITTTPSATATVTATPTAPPEPTATTRPNYRLLAQEPYCETGESVPLLVVETQDALLNQLAGVEVLVTWEGGEDHFFTGFQPERGAGYGDFEMTPGVSYTIQLADVSPQISGLRLEPCLNGAEGGWWLTFQNLRLRLTATPEP